MHGNHWTIPRKRFLEVAGISAIIVIVGVLILNTRTHVQQDYVVVFSFGVNIAYFFVHLIGAAAKHSYSYDMMMWLFSIFFFGFAPLLQFFTGRYSWGLVPESSEIIRTNLYYFLFAVCYSLGRKNKLRIRRKKKTGRTIVAVRNDRFTILLLVSFLIALYEIRTVGITNIFYRSSSGVGGLSTTMSLLVTHVFKNLVLFTAVLCVIKCKTGKRIGFETILAFLFLLLSCFPTGLSRSMAASMYGGLFLLILIEKRDKRWLTLAVIGGLVLVFPALEVFRNAATARGGDLMTKVLNSIQNSYIQAHYDAHQMFISIMRYVSQFGYSYGNQLLGALLFFIPRSVWPSKPVGTGATVITSLRQSSFTNVSAPYASEGFVNFGLLGLMIFGVVLGIAASRVDRRFWSDARNLSITKMLYPFIMLRLFFMLRGDLLSGWSYLFAQLVVGYLVLRFATRRTD